MNARKLRTVVPLILNLTLGLALGMPLAVSLHAQTPADPADLPKRGGDHDFDFLIGDWKAHVRRLPDRLNKSNFWVEYDGISNHKKLLDSNANFEEFDVTSTDKKLRIKAQTLRLYNPTSRQWSIYLVDLDNGTLDAPPVVGGFTGNRGEFFHQNSSKAAPFLCATSGLIFPPSLRAWSSLTRRMAARPGRSTGFASFRDKRPASNNA